MNRRIFALEEDVFKVIANHKRLEIIQLLNRRELNVKEMTSMLGLRQANLSQHLALLRQHKILVVSKRGREVYYKLADNNIAKAVQMIRKFLQDRHGLQEPVVKDSVFPIVIDPVCLMRISASEAFATVEHNGRTYHFCASGCHKRFLANPGRYVK